MEIGWSTLRSGNGMLSSVRLLTTCLRYHIAGRSPRSRTPRVYSLPRLKRISLAIQRSSMCGLVCAARLELCPLGSLPI